MQNGCSQVMSFNYNWSRNTQSSKFGCGNKVIDVSLTNRFSSRKLPKSKPIIHASSFVASSSWKQRMEIYCKSIYDDEKLSKRLPHLKLLFMGFKCLCEKFLPLRVHKSLIYLQAAFAHVEFVVACNSPDISWSESCFGFVTCWRFKDGKQRRKNANICNTNQLKYLLCCKQNSRWLFKQWIDFKCRNG